MKKILLLFFSLTFLFDVFAQNDTSLIPEKLYLNLQKDSIRKAHKRGDTTFLWGLYSCLGTANPTGSFAKRSGKFNNLGTSTTGFNFNTGIELFINSKTAVSFDYDLSVFSVRNDSLTAYIKKREYLLSQTSHNRSINYPGNFQTSINSFGFGLSKMVHFGNFSIRAKITPSVGRFKYNYLIMKGFNDTTSGVVRAFGEGAENFSFSTIVFYTIRPEIDLSYCFYKNRSLALVFTAKASYLQLNPLISLNPQKYRSQNEIIAIRDKITSVNTSLGINLIFRKTRLK